MKSKIGVIFICLMICVSIAHCGGDPISQNIYDVKNKKETTLARIVPDLKTVRLIFVGELHDNENHHKAELDVIRTLNEAGVKVAIGMEMFSRDSQDSLNLWTEGKMNSKTFQRVYYENWTLPWPLYENILLYARDKKIPLIGLNIPQSVSRKVAMDGFASLSPDEKALLPAVQCKVDKEYEQFVKRAYGGHVHDDMSFTYFCEAQLLWDSAMAVHALDYLEEHPEMTLIVLTGSGHAWKQGIPRQVAARSDMNDRVILPANPGSLDRGDVSTDITDYLWLGL